MNPLKSLMIVDDEKDIVKVLEQSLRAHGFKVAGFSDSLTAIEQFRRESDGYDVILLDVRMPKLSGFEFARLVRKINSNVKIILMTAFEINQSEFEIVMPHTKVDGFVQKPVRAEKLAQIIQMH